MGYWEKHKRTWNDTLVTEHKLSLLTFARPLPVLVGDEFIHNFFFKFLRCPSCVNFSDLIKTLM